MADPTVGAIENAMLKIRRTTDRAGIVLMVSGRLDAENVSELYDSLDAVPGGSAVVLDLTDLVLADRDVIQLLRELEASERIVLRNCPEYVRIWMRSSGC